MTLAVAGLLKINTKIKNKFERHIRPNKKINCFSGTAASVFKALHYIFLLLSKIKIKTRPVASVFQKNGQRNNSIFLGGLKHEWLNS